MSIIGALITGIVAGWLGSKLYKGSGLGLFGNLVIGLLGSVVGFWLFGKLGISLGNGWISSVLTGAIGAIVILVVINLLFQKK
jgi:uncharacterized membrane protein YeaQ/YmgE (transglycosylase-associated protein family)